MRCWTAIWCGTNRFVRLRGKKLVSRGSLVAVGVMHAGPANSMVYIQRQHVRFWAAAWIVMVHRGAASTSAGEAQRSRQVAGSQVETANALLPPAQVHHVPHQRVGKEPSRCGAGCDPGFRCKCTGTTLLSTGTYHRCCVSAACAVRHWSSRGHRAGRRRHL